MFRFKQFTIQDDRCAMKVGTDGTLLGAWAHTDFTQKGQSPLCNILDIGTGSGLVALMLAQRFAGAQILGIDIDPEAVEQARENFAASPWGERLNAETIRLQELADKPEMQGRFALVVSNPPYFADSLKNPDAGRKTARHTDTLSFEELMAGAAQLLSDEGVLALVLPAEAEQEIVRLARENGLTPCRLTRVYTRAGKPCKRILVSFRKTTKWGLSLNGSFLQEDGLCLMGADGAPRSKEYQALTKEFYLDPLLLPLKGGEDDGSTSSPTKTKTKTMETEYISERAEKVLTWLNEHQVAYSCYSHPEGKTIEEAKRWWHDDGSVHCKNLFFRNHKGNQHYLVCFHCDHDMDIHDLEQRLKARLMAAGQNSPGKLSFASPERMMRYLGLEPGSVSPFGLINDEEHHVILFLDANLLQAETLSFHPNDCRGTVVIPRTELERVLAILGNTYEYTELY